MRIRRIVVAMAVLAAVCAPVLADGVRPAAAAPTGPRGNAANGFGSVEAFAGQAPGQAAPVVGMAARTGGGFWLASSDGGVFAFAGAPFHGSLGGLQLNSPIIGMAASPDGGGYWLVAADGGVFAFGTARFLGSLGATALNRPIVGMAASPNGAGYWLVASDGGVFAFGVPFHGSTGGIALNRPVVGMAPTPKGDGYWLVASDGGVFGFDAPFVGSLGGTALNQPITSMAASPTSGGYWLVGADGGVFSFEAPFFGSNAGQTQHPAVAIAAAPGGGGYWIAHSRNPFGPALSAWVASRRSNVTAAVLDIASGRVEVFRPGVSSYTASTVKADILGTLLVRAQAEGRGLTEREQSLAWPMITESNDAAASSLWVQLGWPAVADFIRRTGQGSTSVATDGTWGRTRTTALDRLALMRHIVFPNGVLTDGSRAYMLDLMRNVVPSQRWGAGSGVPAGVEVALKNGFVGVQANTMGWVRGQGRDYLIAVLSDGSPSLAYGIETVSGVGAIVWNALAP